MGSQRTSARAAGLVLSALAVGVGTTAATWGAGSTAPFLERVEATRQQGGIVQLVLTCQPPLQHYQFGRRTDGEQGLFLFLEGYRSQAPPDVPLTEGDLILRISEEEKGVRVDIPAPGLELQEVRLDGPRLVLNLRSLAPALAPAAGAAGESEDLYRVGPGDLLAISVFGHEDLSKEVRVLSNGVVNFPLLGDIPVSGLTPHEISGRLSVLLGRDYVVNPQVLVGVSEYQSRPVNVVGEVRKPGKIFLKGPTRLIDILSEAGGLTEDASEQILITRAAVGGSAGEPSRQIRISTGVLFVANNEAHNVPIRSGDVVHVPRAASFYIRGEVGRPGQYPLKTETTIQKAISLAGGFTQWADQKDVQLIRSVHGEEEKMVLNIRKIQKGQAQDVRIESEDIIIVSRRLL